MIIPVALAGALHACAPAASPDTMAAIIAVESGGWPYAINDNTVRRSYRPRSRVEAIAIAKAALRAHHSVDIGIAQVNNANFPALHVDAVAMLDPCTNLRVGSEILAETYTRATRQYPRPAEALVHALMAYNTGSIYAGSSYVEKIVSAAASPAPIVPSIALVAPQTANILPIFPPVQVLSQRPDTARQHLPTADPRKASLHVSNGWAIVKRAGVERNFDLDVNHPKLIQRNVQPIGRRYK